MTSTKESTKGLDTSTQDNEVSWREKFKNGLKQGEVKWAIGAVVTLLWLRALLLWITGLNDFDIIYGYVVLSLLIIYLLAFLACVTSLFESCSFFIAYVIFAATIFLTISNQAMSSVILAVVTAPAMLLLRKVFSERNFGRKVLGNLLLSSSIIFVLWQIFMPDSDEKALNIKGLAHVFEVYYRNFTNIVCLKCDIFSNQSPLLELGNRVVFVIALGVFIYTALICTAIKSFLRWVLYFIAGFGALFTGVSYFHDSSITIQIASFCLFLVIFCSILPFIADDIEKEYPEVSEQLGRTRAYNRFHAWIRRSLKEGGGKAALLLGGWGVGKTHCLKYLSHRLSLKQPYNDGGIKGRYDKRQYDDDFDKDNAFMGKVKICMVNLWEYSSREEAWNAIVQALGRTILGRYSFLNSITLNKYLPRIMRSLPGGNIFSNLYELFFGGDSDRDEALCEQLSDDIGCNERIVLILDDIERTDFQIIKALPPLIEKLHKIKKLMVICSLAKDELAKVHKKELNAEDSEELALETLTGYLTKIFGYTFSLPNLSMYKRNTYIDERLRKYSDCKLTCRYLKQSGLNFDTPRQIERAIDELGELERQFFYDVDSEKLSNEEIISYQVAHHNVLYTYYSHTAFLVEIIKNFYPQLLLVALNDPDGPVRYARKMDETVKLYRKTGRKGAKNHEGEEEEFEENQYIYNLVQTDRFVADLIKALGDCKEENVQRAVEGEYRRRIVLTTHECEKLYEVLKDREQFSLEHAFKEFFGGEESIPEDIDASGLEFFEYVMRRATDAGTDYAKMLLELIPQGCFQHDAKDENVVFSWSTDHFFHLLYLCTEKVPKDKPLDERLKNVVMQMFDRASILTKYSILHKFFHENDKLLQLKDEIEDRLYYKSISVDKVNGIIEELFKCYVKRYIQGVLESEISIKVIRDNLFGISNFFMFLAERGNYTNIPPDEFIITNTEGISNSIDVLTLPCVCQDHSVEPKIMMSSERMVDLILPILQRGFDIYGVNAVTPAQIDRWIEKCETSIEYWSNGQTELNKLRNYTVGAEKVKKFLEDLKAKKESHEENETEKTSE